MNSKTQGMRIGLFGGAQATPGDVVTEAALGYHEYGDYIVLGEKLGYSSSWLVEHHFTGFAQLSATLNYVSYLCGRTSKIRLGTAVTVVPWHNPVLLAEQVATIDQLSKGRFDFGIGKGYRFAEFHGFDIDQKEASDIFAESLVVMKRAFTETDRWSYSSDRWRFNDIIVEPPVVQRPHPPIWVGAGSEASIRKAAQDGYNLLLDQIATFEMIGERIAIYRDELEKLGKPYDPYKVGATRGLMVANNAAERAHKHEFRGKFITGVQILTTDPKLQARTYAPKDGELTDPREISEAGAIIGSNQEMIDRMGRLYDAGLRNVYLHDLLGSHESLQQFAEEVMPHFVDDATTGSADKVAAE